eukprot:3842518-Rhodomonas_salina.1
MTFDSFITASTVGRDTRVPGYRVPGRAGGRESESVRDRLQYRYPGIHRNPGRSSSSIEDVSGYQGTR